MLAVATALGGDVEIGCPAVGEVARYRILGVTDARAPDGGPSEHLAQADTYRLEVLALGAGRMTLRSFYEGSEIVDPPKDPALAALAAEFAAKPLPPIDLVVDLKTGQVGIIDLTPVAAAFTAEFDALPAAATLSPERQAALRATMLHPTTIQHMYTNPIAPFASLACHALPTGRARWTSAQPDTSNRRRVTRRDGDIVVERSSRASAAGLRQVAEGIARRAGTEAATGEAALDSLTVGVTLVIGESALWPTSWDIETVTTTANGASVTQRYQAEKLP